jgi:membrane protein required for colicin V production
MNWLDIVVIVMLIAVTLAAYSAGLIREMITLVAVVVGIAVAGALYDDLAKDVIVFEGNQSAAEATSFLMLFGAVYLLGQIGAYVLKAGASLVMLGPLNHMGGAVFGLVKGILLVQVLLITFAAYPSLGLDETIDDSAIARRFVDQYEFELAILPSNFDRRIAEFLEPDDPVGEGDGAAIETPTPVP